MKTTSVARIDLSLTMVINESEARALDALIGYGTDPFLKFFYAHMGKHYMQPHEAGLRSLFDAIGSEVRPALRRIDNANRVFTGETSLASRAEAKSVSDGEVEFASWRLAAVQSTGRKA